MIRITCSNCQKPLSLDETKLPADREVSFPCPVCKAKLTVDRRNLGAQQQQAAVAPSAPPPQEDDHADEFGAKALIVGADNPAIRQAAKLIGFLPVHQPEPQKAREFFNQELPQVVFLNPSPLTPPPLEAMNAMLSVVPSDRRKAFYVLVADNLRTLDGNAAFLYGVNLVVATKDLGQFPQIYRDAYGAHERLYAGMNAVLREKQLA
ncbi:MAG: hypothetical protein ACLGH0_12585 [Thermoanaerobaculia bacterium]